MENKFSESNNRNIDYHNGKTNRFNMNDNYNDGSKNNRISKKENNYEIKTFNHKRKKNTDNEQKENLIMNPIKLSERNKKKMKKKMLYINKLK